jgi:hypothetical protein
MRIYVASSWRNAYQPEVVALLRRRGHDVYDFKNPAPGNTGFSWSAIDPAWKEWTPDAYRRALEHPIAADGYGHDIRALRGCEACVLVLPSGRSASWEFGFAMGQGKLGVVFMPDACEPEPMYREAAIVTTPAELHDMFNGPDAVVERFIRSGAPRSILPEQNVPETQRRGDGSGRGTDEGDASPEGRGGAPLVP